MNDDMQPFALVTGASSGIGEAFARRLASQGFNLILLARRKDRLHELAAELEQKHGRPVEVLAADLSIDSDIQRVEKHIQQLAHLDLLVNNAGYGMSGSFSKIELEKHLEMIQVHINAAVRLTYAALPGMIARRRGIVINVSSVAAFVPWGNVTYNATKAYLVAFSEALNAESSSKNVYIQALCPGFTVSEFHNSPNLVRVRKLPLPKFFWLTPDYVVSESLKAMTRRRAICVPGPVYQIVVALGRSAITGPLLRAAVIRFRKRSAA